MAVLLVRVVDYGELRDALGGVKLPWALAALAAVQAVIILRTYRWIAIHEAFALAQSSLFYQLRLTYATTIATLVLPQFLSPFSRLALLLQDGSPARRAAPAAVIEKGFEAAAFLAFGLLGSIILASEFGGLVWWAVGLTLLVVAAGVGAYLGREHLGRLVGAVLDRLPGAEEMGGADGAEVARNAVSLGPRVLVVILSWSLAAALAQATLLYLLSRSLGVGLSYPFMVAVWGIVAFSMLLPISVSGIGTREAILVIAFDAADKSTDAAVALGFLVLGALAVGSSPGALEWLWRFWVGGRGNRDGKPPESAAVTPRPKATASEGEGSG